MKSTTRKDILAQIADTILKNRQDIYGPPEDSFSTIADLWTVYLSKHTPGPLHPHDVAAMMALLKLARIMAKPTHPDNWVDLAGYGVCGGELASLFAALQKDNSKSIGEELQGATQRSDTLSPDEQIELSYLANMLHKSTIVNWLPIDRSLFLDAILHPTTMTPSDLTRLRNLARL